MAKHAVIYRRKLLNTNLRTGSLKVGVLHPPPASYAPGKVAGRKENIGLMGVMS